MGRLLYIAAVLTSWVKLSILTDILFILPDNPSNTSCPSQPCATLSQYSQDYNGTLPVVSNVEYQLLPGEHNIPPNMELFGLYNFKFIGITDKCSSSVTLISCSQSFLKIIESEHLVIRNVVFKHCRNAQSDQQYNGDITNLYIGFCWSCTIENVTFLEYGLTGHNIYGRSVLNNIVIDLTITSTSTYLNYHGIKLAYSRLPRRSLDSSMVCILNGVSVSGHGGKYLPNNSYIRNNLRAIAIAVSLTNYHFTIEIKNSHFHDLDQGLMIVRSFSTIRNITVLIENCIFEYIAYSQSKASIVPVVDMHLLSTSTVLSFSGCTFQYTAWWFCTIKIDLNIDPIPSSKRRAAKVFIQSCTFFGNNNPLLFISGYETGSDYLQLGPIEMESLFIRKSVLRNAIHINLMNVHIQGPVIMEKNWAPESLLMFEKCSITICENIVFKSNVCSYVITLTSGTLFIALAQNTSITFFNNCVFNKIIEADSDQYYYNNPYPYCIFQLIESHNTSTSTTPLPTDYRITFDNNNYCIKNGTVNKCKITLYHYTSHCRWVDTSAFHGYDPTIINKQIIVHHNYNNQMNKHKTICHCLNNVTDCSLDVLGKVYPGQTLQVELCLPCSGKDATLHVETHHRVLPLSSCKISHQNQLINFLTTYNNRLNFTIASNATEICELFLTVSPYLYQIYEAFYVKLLPCPIGFVLQNGICDCDPVLSSNKFVPIKACNIDQLTIKRPQNSWIAPLTSNNSTYSVCSNCPMDYCIPHASDLNLQDPDLQCQFNRTGILCSQCQHSLSMVFGSSRCIHCTNIHILISVVILFAGITIVVILYLLNLTVTNGTITGVIFYANIISINNSTFLANDNIFKPLRVFISFVNLDLGIETCFYNGLDSYAKMFLQLYFPFYLIIISIFIIIVSRYSTRMLQWTSTRSLPVLATLFLLSYTSIIRTVLTVLFSYSTITQLPNDHLQIVWSIDASIPLLGIKFVTLFIICLLLFLFLVPFNITLLFVRSLSRFKIVNHFKPFLDAFQGSFKDKYHYWLGIQISLRSLFFVFYIFRTQIKLILSTIVLLCYSLSFGYIYPNKNKLVNIQELLLLLNLTIIYAVSYQSNTKIFSSFTNILAVVTFIQFCLIILYHILIYTLHCDLVNVFKWLVKKITPVNKSNQLFGHKNAPLNIPDCTHNYTEYREGLVSDDFRYVELSEFVSKTDKK